MLKMCSVFDGQEFVVCKNTLGGMTAFNKQGLKVHLPECKCDEKLSAGNQNFTRGHQHATNIAMANNDVQGK